MNLSLVAAILNSSSHSMVTLDSIAIAILVKARYQPHNKVFTVSFSNHIKSRILSHTDTETDLEAILIVHLYQLSRELDADPPVNHRE